jgi:antitoxin HigA-1
MADFPPTHPGKVLREDFLKPLQLSQYALAKALRVPQIRISEIVNGKRAITPDQRSDSPDTSGRAPNSG